MPRLLYLETHCDLTNRSGSYANMTCPFCFVVVYLISMKMYHFWGGKSSHLTDVFKHLSNEDFFSLKSNTFSFRECLFLNRVHVTV